MGNLPAAEIDVSEQLVRRLLTDQHPDVSGLSLRLVANGWDNVIYRLGDELTVRLPRRQQAAQLVVHEQQWLPVFEQRLKVQIPTPVRVGEPASYYPWAWSICPWFEGIQAAEVPIAERTGLAESLAGFVSELHRPAPPNAPHNPVRGIPLRNRHAAVAQRLASGAIPNARQLAALWDDACAVPAWSGPPLWLHGDLHPANILVPNGRKHPIVPCGPAGLTAILDFGDLTAGDPATDLATAWLTFSSAGRRVFIDKVNELCGYDANTWNRARGWALIMATAMYVSSDDHPILRKVGDDSLEQLLT